MLNAFWWYLTVQAVGLAAFPLAYLLLPRLRDRGYSIAKPLGILLIGYASWILSVLHILPSVRLSIVALLLVMGGLSARYVWGRRREFKEFVVRERAAILAGEAIFLAFFVGWAIYRAYDPAISHTEQPMDFAFLNASIQSDVGAPEDPWLRGESVSYYYFGYWMMGAASQMAGVASNISYNLSLALIPAMGGMAIFGLVYNLIGSEVRRWRYALAGGFAAALLLGVASNLEGVLEFMRANAIGSQGFYDWVRIDGLDGPSPNPADSWMPQEFGWWWRASRVINTFDGAQGIDFTIQEFPSFSFILGDLHPHVMSIPFVILFLAFCWNFLRSPTHIWKKRDLRGYASILAMGLALGGLAFTNMWNLPTFSALLLGIAALKAYRAQGAGTWALLKGAVPIWAAVTGLALLLFLPYYLTFNSSLTGIHLVDGATTRPIHMFIVWGLYMVAVTPFIVVTFWQTTVTNDWPRLTAIALLVGFLPYAVWALWHLVDGGTAGDLAGRFLHVLPFAILISVAVYNAFWLIKEGGPSGKLFAMVLSALGLLLIMGPELLFVGDVFGNRMNTVFKLYYQSWLLLAAVSGFGLYYWRSLREALSGWRHSLTTLWAGVFVVLLIGSLYYLPAAAASKGELSTGDATLDGLAFVADSRKAEYEAIEYIRKEAGRDSAILEAVGGQYSEFGRISSSTGVPTVLNWSGAQRQWRGSRVDLVPGDEGVSEACQSLDAAKATGFLACRELDVARIYQTQDVEEARNLLARYDVEYVYVGPRERDKYGAAGLDKFQIFMDTVFSLDSVAIYRMK